MLEEPYFDMIIRVSISAEEPYVDVIKIRIFDRRLVCSHDKDQHILFHQTTFTSNRRRANVNVCETDLK